MTKNTRFVWPLLAVIGCGSSPADDTSDSGSSSESGGVCEPPQAPGDAAPIPTCDDVRDIDEPTPEEIAEAAGAPCTRHSDCTQGLNGRCVTLDTCESPLSLVCSYDECITHEDCDAGERCFCDEGGMANNVCAPVECEADDECDGGRCLVARIRGACGPRTLIGQVCQDCTDGCFEDSQCPPGYEGISGVCAYSGTQQAWGCEGGDGCECPTWWVP